MGRRNKRTGVAIAALLLLLLVGGATIGTGKDGDAAVPIPDPGERKPDRPDGAPSDITVVGRRAFEADGDTFRSRGVIFIQGGRRLQADSWAALVRHWWNTTSDGSKIRVLQQPDDFMMTSNDVFELLFAAHRESWPDAPPMPDGERMTPSNFEELERRTVGLVEIVPV